MAEKAEVQKRMQTMVDQLNEVIPDTAAEWGGAVQFTFPDLATGWLVKMAMDGTVESGMRRSMRRQRWCYCN